MAWIIKHEELTIRVLDGVFLNRPLLKDVLNHPNLLGERHGNRITVGFIEEGKPLTKLLEKPKVRKKKNAE